MSVFLAVHSTCQWHAGKTEVSVVVLDKYGTVFCTFFYRYSSLALTYAAFSCISTTGVFDKPPSLLHTCHAGRNYV